MDETKTKRRRGGVSVQGWLAPAEAMRVRQRCLRDAMPVGEFVRLAVLEKLRRKRGE